MTAVSTNAPTTARVKILSRHSLNLFVTLAVQLGVAAALILF